MITEHQEIARYRVAEQLRAAEARAQRHDRKPATNGPRHGLATALRRLADRLEPASRRLAEPQPRHRGNGLSVVR
ncbi:hypothetical protein AB0E63_04950 [Kribbella sp. NPDC026596]|jgi:predicted alpha/beta-hydrolase family hydrolase|uniref:hypothetical protein n=1 Tax=Kribbella sp. NPDC026596 TaxID=3155122 RepID=UPI0033F0169C